MIKYWTVQKYNYTEHHIKGAKFGDMDMEAFYKYLSLSKERGKLNFKLSHMNIKSSNYFNIESKLDYIKREQLVALLDSYGVKGSSLIRNYRNDKIIVH